MIGVRELLNLVAQPLKYKSTPLKRLHSKILSDLYLLLNFKVLESANSKLRIRSFRPTAKDVI